MRLVALTVGTVLAGLALFEVSMQPSAAERIELGVIFATMATLMGASVRLLPTMAKRIRSIRTTMAVLALTAFSIVVAGALAVGSRMFLSAHDLTLLLVVLGFGVISAVAFVTTVTRPLTADLDRLSEQAALVAEGVLETRASIDRRDEVGRLGAAVDHMIAELDDAEAARRASDDARRMFLSSVGHDLRTPLASLRASVEAIQDEVFENPHRYLNAMASDIAALTTLVDDINLLARLDSGTLDFERRDVDVTEIADEAIDVLRPLADVRGVSLRLSAVRRTMAVGHPEHVGRALRNLIDNAVRHAPDSSEVTVDVSSRSDAAVVTVTDRGPGFDAEFVASAFDRFSRADPSRVRETGGSGLGLAIVEGLITALDGRVWVDAGPGGRVGFELPISASMARAQLENVGRSE